MLLKDAARLWHEALVADQRQNYEIIKRNFLLRFAGTSVNRWKDAAAVWTTAQAPFQSVENYLYELEQKARRTKIEPQQLLFSAINGLRPGIRQQVLIREPQTMEDLRRWALTAEAAGEKDDVSAMLQRIEEKFNRLQLAQVDCAG